MFTVSDESFTSDPVFVTLDIVLANDNAPVVIASPLGQVSHPSPLHLHLLLNTVEFGFEFVLYVDCRTCCK